MSAPIAPLLPDLAFIAWLRDCAYVKTADGWLPFLITLGQLLAIEELDFFRLVGGWWAAVKARSVGFTTLCLLWSIWRCITKPGAVIKWIIPHDDFGVKILAAFRDIMAALQTHRVEGCEAGVYPDNKDMAGFPNRSRIMWGVVGGTVGTADAVGRGEPVDAVICTEFGYPHDPELLRIAVDGLMPALERWNAPVLIDSTPNGDGEAGGVYYDTVQEILNGKLKGGVFLFGWWMEPTYRDGVADPAALVASYTAEEFGLVAQWGWTPEQVAWRRRKRGTTPKQQEKFAEDYPEDLKSAFTPRGGDHVVSQAQVRAIEAALKHAPSPLTEDELGRAGLKRCGVSDPLMWREQKGRQGFFRVWRAPVAGGRYFGALDGADGLPGSDWQSLSVLDEWGKVCAFGYWRIDPIRVGAATQRVCEWYGVESLTIEMQKSEPAYSVVKHATAMDSAAVRGADDAELEVLRHRAGFRIKVQHTGESVHDEAMDGALRLFDRAENVPDYALLVELRDLRRWGQVIKAREGGHDDGLMSVGLAERARRKALQRAVERGGGERRSERGRRGGGGEFVVPRVRRGGGRGRYGYLD